MVRQCGTSILLAVSGVSTLLAFIQSLGSRKLEVYAIESDQDTSES